jgi:hypothetical protein
MWPAMKTNCPQHSAPKSIAPLIDVNKTIMRGLRDEAKV